VLVTHVDWRVALAVAALSVTAAGPIVRANRGAYEARQAEVAAS
jgi:hypothetical protein